MNAKNNPYNSSAIFKSWNVIYPIFIYFVVTNLAMSLFAMFASFLGADIQEQYMALQTAAVAVTIPFMVRYYSKDRKVPTVFWKRMELMFQKKSLVQKAGNGVLMFLAGAFVGAALNNLLALTTLKEISQGFQEVNSYFFAGGIFFELLGACLLTPFLEELLYRSVVYARLCDLLIVTNEEKTEKGRKKERQSRLIAMTLSALLFGVLHQNLVQFVYAGALGIMLAWFVEEAGHFYGAFLAHVGANLISVLRVETGMLRWMEQSRSVFAGATAGLAVISAVLLGGIWGLNKKRQ
ncbi:CPBP family intramembrane metalloprotease [Petralouisia muris]|jgi:membrane protease YdiL (CAAX protease family)|uniref:CPBP family intramembrane metalloprotease n=1 Tax=Petralouisia muris TaxID=3032872 RepID=A0AC61S127_9FIRM|nr:type II CAAX endopeptidase family protein [Petralouisia muris]TGY97681.1 CPBP family intramembrane metalloprotease [Petralouisia muris]